jgi:hypothetical protein
MITTELIIVFLSVSSALDWLTELESHAYPTKSRTFR